MAGINSPLDDKAKALGNAVPFDLCKTSKAQQVEKLAKHLYELCICRKDGPRFGKIADVIISVLMNLVAAREQDQALFVRFSRRNGRYRRSRYNPQYIGSKNLKTVVDSLHRVGLIEFHRGIPAPAGFKGGKQSRMRSTPEIVRLLREFKVDSKMIDQLDDEVIILRGKKDRRGYAKQIDYSDSHGTKKMRENLKLINRRITAISPGIDIQLSHKEMEEMREQLILDQDKDPFDISRTRLRRIFNNESFKEGGRFYHGWWQNIPRKYRSFIQINGRVTREVDYSGIHFAIFYAEVGLEPDEDPYSLPRATISDREIIKKALNIAINADSRAEAKRAIRRESKFSHELPAAYPGADSLLDALIQRHNPIKQYIGSGAGRRGQYIDSQIAEQVMLRLGKQGIIVLPVHDSFIVESDKVEELKKTMEQAFRDIVSAECKVDVKTPTWEEPEFDLVHEPVDFKQIWPEMDLRDQPIIQNLQQ